ncbi:cellulose synthase/poly-beta-1,6-N-acetylglucosamine synthase-like glycosyltransferase [Bacillus mesophilus]|uniref:Glycosyltransferase n=1 Tax=Bacillus mesophilus TaxID=1808955 RepID=A0A6M0QD93_9BACI|nr:cellulose synthase/poly-beta-1,6-N-acetylglucosamine synthase-like glycosyltransferase [Bacillus mesophilus]NEY73058.1 glycosyltransferase [Bacillus mesophilus]
MVAFVQLPQAFYNDDIYQFNLLQSKNIPNEQDLFMRLIQTGRDRFNSTIYIGSNTIFRRVALDAIGGFATGTITEDMATGMLIQSKGYKTVFHNEVLAQGLAAESLSDFLSQRIRWARGTIQTMRKWNPITLPGYL